MQWRGPVEKLNGHLVIHIPLREGGDQLKGITRGLSDIEGDALKIVLPTWMAEELHIVIGSEVLVEDKNGQFSIQLVSVKT